MLDPSLHPSLQKTKNTFRPKSVEKKFLSKISRDVIFFFSSFSIFNSFQSGKTRRLTPPTFFCVKSFFSHFFLELKFSKNSFLVRSISRFQMDNDYKYRPLINLVSRDGSSGRTLRNGPKGPGLHSTSQAVFLSYKLTWKFVAARNLVSTIAILKSSKFECGLMLVPRLLIEPFKPA